jgi:hypothetical protein
LKPSDITTKIIFLLLIISSLCWAILSINYTPSLPIETTIPTATPSVTAVDLNNNSKILDAGPAKTTPTTSIFDDNEEEIIDELPTLEPLIITPTTTPTPTKSKVEPTPTNLPAIQALDSLQRSRAQQNQNNDSGLANSNVGFLTRNSNSSNPDEAPATATPTSDGSLPLLSGQARGYAMLYMMHPKARPVVEAEIDTLIKANVQEVYLSVLVDGTFGKDHAYLQSILTKLNQAGRIITLEQYLVSGPTMRRFKTTPIRTPFSILDPELFRTFYLYEPDIEQEVRRVAREARASFEFNTNLNRGNTNLVAVMLEDNLDSPSYRYMRNIVSQEIGNTATFIRNACPDCYTGNDAETFGDPLELHPVEMFPELSEKDGYTLDGVDVMYPFDEKVNEVTVDDVKSMLSESVTKKLSFFGLWRRGRQGLGSSGQAQHPDERTYIVPTEEEKKIEIELLREGLLPAAE